MAETTEKRTVLEEAALDYMRRGAGDGTVIRIVGSIVDVKFDDGVPRSQCAGRQRARRPLARSTSRSRSRRASHGNVVRCVAMESTDGLSAAASTIPALP